MNNENKATASGKDKTPVQIEEATQFETSLTIAEHNVQKTQKPKYEDTVDEKLSEGSLPERFQAVTSYKQSPSGIEKILTCMSYLIFLLFFPLSLFFVFMVVRQFERVVILRHGKVYKNKSMGPGLVHYLPCVDMVKFTDLRIVCYAVPPEEALTKDSLSVSVDAVVYYQIYRPIWAIVNVTDFRTSTQLLAATALRNAIGTEKLSSILGDRPGVSTKVYLDMKSNAREWGIQIIKVEIKDIIVPVTLQKAMAAEAESTRLANAKIIVAQAEIESTRNLQSATTILMANPFCMQLRYLQSLHMIAGDKTHTIVVPYSIDLIKKMFK